VETFCLRIFVFVIIYIAELKVRDNSCRGRSTRRHSRGAIGLLFWFLHQASPNDNNPAIIIVRRHFVLVDSVHLIISFLFDYLEQRDQLSCVHHLGRYFVATFQICAPRNLWPLLLSPMGCHLI